VIADLSDRIAAAVGGLPEEDRSDPGFVCLRGIRGLPAGRLAELVGAAWRASPARLPDDAAALKALWATAWEDGLAAIGLCATAVADSPREVLQLGLEWAELTDDVATADAIGWLLLGPATAALGPDAVATVDEALLRHPKPEARRAGVAMGLAWTPEKLEGPAAAALREARGTRQVRLAEVARSDLLGPLVAKRVRDADPAVQKALRRVLRAWVDADGPAVVAWAPTVPGGLPRLLGTEVDRARASRRKR
jgi:hypothetical protein